MGVAQQREAGQQNKRTKRGLRWKCHPALTDRCYRPDERRSQPVQGDSHLWLGHVVVPRLSQPNVQDDLPGRNQMPAGWHVRHANPERGPGVLPLHLPMRKHARLLGTQMRRIMRNRRRKMSNCGAQQRVHRLPDGQVHGQARTDQGLRRLRLSPCLALVRHSASLLC